MITIDNGKLKEAANYHYRDDLKDVWIKAFIVGANWFHKSLWHDASEKPKEGEQLLIISKRNGFWIDRIEVFRMNPAKYRTWEECRKAEKIVYWLYIDDLTYKIIKI